MSLFFRLSYLTETVPETSLPSKKIDPDRRLPSSNSGLEILWFSFYTSLNFSGNFSGVFKSELIDVSYSKRS